MSEMTPVGGEATPSETPPAVGGGGKGLPTTAKLPKRRIVGVSKTAPMPTSGEIIPETPPPSLKGLTQSPSPMQTVTSPTSFGYTGQGLVNGSGIIERNQYVVGGDNDEAYAELAKMGTNRFAFLNALAALGIYSGPSPTGYASKDLSAVRQAMMTANAEGVTLDVVLPLIATKYGARGGRGGGVSVRTSPAQDLREVFKQVSLNVLGRALPESEIERFVRSYQSQQTAEAMGGPQAPSAQVAAEAQIQQGQGAEATAVGMLQLANVFDQAIKGLA